METDIIPHSIYLYKIFTITWNVKINTEMQSEIVLQYFFCIGIYIKN